MPGTANNAKATILSSFGWSLQKSRASLYRSVGSGYIDVCPDYPGSNSSSSQILVPSFFLLILILVLLKCHLVVPFFFLQV
jgi:hypothetical protein